ncbi:hypothetical protein AJ80_00959 [Polytolypa hystricis UAMH7299]|uniref:Rhodopsin domain-containing protein n=1 Tax=Polytolypa hystricis (strain UAMH7299) TaxID=1447883 RepID=A0A2B7Z1Y5_POLH7|nr:hypothetical protein AJ80_00959 [Polytolypa hystricis UAMH7299]
MVDTLQSAILTIIVVFPCIGVVVVVLRIISRTVSRTWGLVTKESHQGYRIEDAPKLSPDEVSRYQSFNLANQLLYNPILAFVRASVVVFILRLKGLPRHIKLSLYTLFIVNLALAIAIFFTDLLQCMPLHYTYDYLKMDKAAQQAAGADANGMKDGKLIKGGHCINTFAFFIASGAMSIVLDVWVILIPTRLVWGLNMPRRQKVIVVFILGMGGVSMALGIVRLVVLSRRWANLPKPDRHEVNFTLSNIEVNISIWASALPALKALASRIFPRFLAPLAIAPDHPSAEPISIISGALTQAAMEPRTPTDLVDRLPRRPKLDPSQPSAYRMNYLRAARRGITPSEEDIVRFEHDMNIPKLTGRAADAFYVREGHLPESRASMSPTTRVPLGYVRSRRSSSSLSTSRSSASSMSAATTTDGASLPV